MKAIDLKNNDLKVSFQQFLRPALTGTCIKSIFILTDMAIIAAGVGSTAMAAMSLAMPFVTLLSSITMMIAMGGAIASAMLFGEHNLKERQRVFETTLLFVVLVNLVFTAFCLISLDWILDAMGTSEALRAEASLYLSLSLTMYVLHSIVWSLSAFIKNDLNPRYEVGVILLATLINLTLDVLFVFVLGWGLKGIALAGGITNFIACALLAYHFIQAKGSLKLKIPGRLHLSQLRAISHLGFPVFVTEMMFAIVGFMMNYALINHFSEHHLASFGVLTNISAVVIFLLIGVANASQPIVSFFYGHQSIHKVKQTLLLSLKYATLTGVFITTATLVFSEPLSRLYSGDNSALFEINQISIPLYFSGIVFLALNMAIISFLQAISKSKESTMLAALKGMVIYPLVLLIALKLDTNAIWLVGAVSELMLLGISCFVLVRTLNNIEILPRQQCGASHHISSV